MTVSEKVTLSLNKEPEKKPLIYVFAGEWSYFLSYQFHPLYYWKWSIYLGIYIIILLFTLVVQKIQRIQIQKRLDTEKKITELQLKIVRNQMDPHFTMNALNTVIGAINKNDKEAANENLMHFTQMYRSLVLSADKFKVSIQEELNFTENYLKLERFRFKDKFDYMIRLDESVEKDWYVPKMIIQNPVENAVKHGLSKKDGKGKLEIDLTTKDDRLIINVTDNGIGRPEASKSDEKSTGKGLQMMSQFYDLYYQITKVKIKEEIHDLRDENGNPSGTQVSISIPLINK